MDYLNQILFFFGAIGVFNGFILSIYLLVHKSYAHLSHKLFGLLLFVLSMRVLKSLFYAFSTEEPIWFLQFGPTFMLFIGPLLFSYVLSVIKPASFWVNCWKQHLLFWFFVVVALMILFPFKNHVELNKQVLLPIINAQWLLYLLSAAWVVRKHFNLPKSKWLLLLLLAVFTIWISFAVISFKYFVIGSIVFSVLFYALTSLFFFKQKMVANVFTQTVQKSPPIQKGRAADLLQRLNNIMINEKLFTQPDLKLSDVAGKLDITTHELSKLINENIDKNFTHYINEYRIKEAKQLIKKNSIYTIEAIGNQSGFKSKSAFYKAFKKFVGTTPAKFKAQL